MKRTMAPLLLGLIAGLCCLAIPASAQNKTVKGKVIDSQGGAALGGVTVLIKGTTNGTQTESDGTFSVSVPETATLVFSSVGYVTQEVSVAGKSEINVVLVSSASSNLNEVVVVGYGTQRKKDLTGAVAQVKAKDLLQGVFTAPDQALQGKVAGVQIINNSGAPGGATTVRIRGISSVRSGNEPLFVVDGVPLSGSASSSPGVTNLGALPGNNPLNFINPADIATIDVLKDASATAIFGSRGANGVVIITTKKGQSGTPKLEAGASVGFGSPMKRLDVLNGDEYRQALKDYGITGGNFNNSVDAFDAILRKPAVTQNYTLGITGGNDAGRYRASFGFMDQQGIIQESGFKKFSANISGSYKFLSNKRLGLDFNLITAATNTQAAPVSNDAGFQGSLIANALQWNPTASLDWSPSKPIDPALGATTINPLALLGAWDDRNVVNTVVFSVSPSYKLTDWLEYRMLYAVNHEQAERRTELRNWINFTDVQGRGWAQIQNNRLLNQTLNHTLNFNKALSKSINLNAVVGYEYLKYDFRGSGMQGRRFVDYPGLLYTDYMQNVPNADLTVFSYRNPVTEIQSLFARATLNWNDKLLVTGTVRRDGSTKFGENNKYGVFPSFAAAYNLGNEEFISNSSFISNLKLRASWGQTGNQEFPSAASQLVTSIGQAANATLSNLANEDLKWETNTMTNLGVDFGLFGGKLNGSVDWYSRTTTDALFQQNVVQPGPAYRFWVNLPGEIVNSGVELALNWNVMNKQNFVWNIGGNIAFQKNEVRNLQGTYETGALHGQGISGATSQRLTSGQPLNVFYLRQFLGLDKTSGNSTYEDGGNTLYYVGNPNPKTVYGISTDFTFKNKLTVVINANGAGGHFLYNNTANTVLPIGNLGTRNIAANLIGGPVKESRANPIAPSTRYMEKGDYLKLANATVTYRLGDLGKTFKNVSLSLTGQNLFVITSFSGFDPEVNVNKAVNGIPSQGIEYVPYPTARNIIFGVNFGL